MSRGRGRGKGSPGKPGGKAGSSPGGGSRSARRRRRGRGGGPAAARSPTEREFSCGGVVVRDGQCIVIEPLRPDNRRVVALPKGHPELGEDPPTAALREIFEETGVTARVRERLGEIVYWYQRDGKRIRKTVRIYLCSHEDGEPTPDGVEVSDARWMPLREALEELSFPGDRKMVAEALARTTGGR
ncbi:NUDIX hydrolase [Patulibacter defluvii]|uniref:NUDIX hydrolase n=1 Tax=Patulibacter defluvii TaxID=3095358 RepID=UPI002A7521CD|nr:NUDIX domain-containing protein [Patulibacter sp. DM4]